MMGMPAKAYPEGEWLQRELNDDFGRAMEEYNNGNVAVLANFYRLHPEFETRQALWDDPETRLRKFMVDDFWNIWNDLPKIHKDQLKEQLGTEFVDKLLQADRGDVEYSKDLANSVSLDSMQIWLKLMGGDPPGSLNSETPPIELAPPEFAWRAEAFYNTRNAFFPDWYDTQGAFFDLPEKSKARKDYLSKHPELIRFWDWRDDWFHRNPDVVPYLDDSYEFQYTSKAQEKQYEQAQPAFTWDEWQAFLPQPVPNLVLDYFYNGDDLPPTAQAQLESLAEQLGITYEDMLSRIETSLQ